MRNTLIAKRRSWIEPLSVSTNIIGPVQQRPFKQRSSSFGGGDGFIISVNRSRPEKWVGSDPDKMDGKICDRQGPSFLRARFGSLLSIRRIRTLHLGPNPASNQRPTLPPALHSGRCSAENTEISSGSATQRTASGCVSM